jgi:hypothetical protein|nr:MAG TPA: hypothetical protein [Caudoviricetes sp.]
MQKLLQIINDKNTVNIGNTYDNLVHLRNWRIKVTPLGDYTESAFLGRDTPPFGFGLYGATKSENDEHRRWGPISPPQCIAAIKALGIPAYIGSLFAGHRPPHNIGTSLDTWRWGEETEEVYVYVSFAVRDMSTPPVVAVSLSAQYLLTGSKMDLGDPQGIPVPDPKVSDERAPRVMWLWYFTVRHRDVARKFNSDAIDELLHSFERGDSGIYFFDYMIPPDSNNWDSSWLSGVFPLHEEWTPEYFQPGHCYGTEESSSGVGKQEKYPRLRANRHDVLMRLRRIFLPDYVRRQHYGLTLYGRPPLLWDAWAGICRYTLAHAPNPSALQNVYDTVYDSRYDYMQVLDTYSNHPKGRYNKRSYDGLINPAPNVWCTNIRKENLIPVNRKYPVERLAVAGTLLNCYTPNRSLFDDPDYDSASGIAPVLSHIEQQVYLDGGTLSITSGTGTLPLLEYQELVGQLGDLDTHLVIIDVSGLIPNTVPLTKAEHKTVADIKLAPEDVEHDGPKSVLSWRKFIKRVIEERRSKAKKT